MTQILLPFDWPTQLTRDQIMDLDLLTFRCGDRWPAEHKPVRSYHAPHEVVDHLGTFECPGMVSRPCSKPGSHTWHRWFEPGRIWWCHGGDVPSDWYSRPSYIAPPMTAETLSRRP